MIGIYIAAAQYSCAMLCYHRPSPANPAVNLIPHKQTLRHTPKTKKSNRIIALPPEVLELVKQFKSERDYYVMNMGDKWHPTERLFTCQDGKPMHSNTPYNWLKRLCDRNNFPFYGIHTFRHFFASAEIEAGIDPVTVVAVLGHSTPKTTVNTSKGHTHTIHNNYAISIQKGA